MKKFFVKLALKFLRWTEIENEIISVCSPEINSLARDLTHLNVAVARIEDRIDRITKELMTLKAAAAMSKTTKKSSKFRKVK